jgi:hypothetical protein
MCCLVPRGALPFETSILEWMRFVARTCGIVPPSR